ncbi:LETM1-like protein [Abeliophyllum distichum]|uniref:LETM1-like protein n=1 Tax=Abeliophyllum distichum TaxID=126358 RepID=A0ABD1V9U9_9LAMI
MAFHFSLCPSQFYKLKAILSDDRLMSWLNPPSPAKIYVKEQERHGLAKYIIPQGFLFPRPFTSHMTSLKLMPLGALSSTESAAESNRIIAEDEFSLAKTGGDETEFNRVNCLVWVLHESARSFSLAIQTVELAKTGPPLAMAWNGVDVNAWQKHIAYQVAVYALLKAAIEVELFLSHKRSNNPSPVLEILSPKTNFLGLQIESQLNTRNPKLVQWFRMVELPRIAGLFFPLFKKWSLEYAGSGIAGTIMAISCCAAVVKLGSARISCPLFSNSIEEASIELMTMSHALVSLEKLHQLASEAGFEENFLSHFGSKILPTKNVEDMEFWIGLIQRKLSTAFRRESVTSGRHISKVQESCLATLGLFAYLGRETRLFLSRHHIKDLEEQIKDFLSYLECGIPFIFPEFSTTSEYQLIMEVIVDEIGWVDFYTAYNSRLFQDRRRSKNHPIQAEQEIILYTVLTICYDVISGFAHYNNSTQQALDSNLLEFLLQSQGLLSTCLEDFWSAYDGTGDMQKIGERIDPDSPPSLQIKGTKNSSLIMEAPQRPADLMTMEKHQHGFIQPQANAKNLADLGCIASLKPTHQNLLRKSTTKMVSASVDVWMGTQILLVDIKYSLQLFAKYLCGYKVTKRENRKMQRTLADIATLIPVTILMLIPVSAVGHAAILAAIKRYMPSLIPSPYSSERLALMKQLKRKKMMEIQQRKNVDDISSKV